jgi:hypothetical protein
MIRSDRTLIDGAFSRWILVTSFLSVKKDIIWEKQERMDLESAKY